MSKAPSAKPWTSVDFKDDFQFAVIGDRTGSDEVDGQQFGATLALTL